MKQAILMVSFGTSYQDTRVKTIGNMAEYLTGEFPEYRIYQAYTSEMILRVLRERDGIHVDTVGEALLRMERDGMERVIVQPTHILNGIENDVMQDMVAEHRNLFAELRIGMPLLSGTEDYEEMIEAVSREAAAYERAENTAVVLMGHGTSHYTNSTYGALDYHLKQKGLDRFYVATVEAYPSIEDAISLMRKKGYKNVLLLPFMIVAGDHARNDMAGDGKDSFKSLLEAEGYRVQCCLKGLGENEHVCRLLGRHVREAKIFSLGK